MRRAALAVVAAIALAWNAALIAAPAGDSPRLASITYLAGSLICHQRPERSLHRDGAQYPVCARCQGLYLGAMVGVFGWAAFAGVGGRPRNRVLSFARTNRLRLLLFFAAAPTLATVALAWAGVWDASNMVRVWLALPLGAAVAATITAVAAGDLR